MNDAHRFFLWLLIGAIATMVIAFSEGQSRAMDNQLAAEKLQAYCKDAPMSMLCK